MQTSVELGSLLADWHEDPAFIRALLERGFHQMLEAMLRVPLGALLDDPNEHAEDTFWARLFADDMKRIAPQAIDLLVLLADTLANGGWFYSPINFQRDPDGRLWLAYGMWLVSHLATYIGDELRAHRPDALP